MHVGLDGNEVIRRAEKDEYIAKALLRLSRKLGIFAQPSA